MSDNELDEILEEIRKFSEEKNKSETNAPEVNEEPKAEEVPAIEEAPVEEAPIAPEVKPEEPVKEEPELTFDAPEEVEAPAEEADDAEDDIFEIVDVAEETPEAPNAPEAPQQEEAEDDVESATPVNEESDEDEEQFFEITPDDEAAPPPANNKKRKAIILIVSIIILLALLIGVYFGVVAKNNDNLQQPNAPATEAISVDKKRGPINPLTGEEGYNEAALTQRPVAVVVENEYSTESVRPQWGMNEADIVLEGESEYSTRTLLFWADYTKVPAQVGPTRSARPPFIRFSQLFDSIFIHAGLSHTKGDYEGADSVFENENVDHINLLKYSEDGKFFGRDYTRTSTVEHTGYLNGENIEALLDTAKINTQIDTDKFTQLSFNKKAEKLSDVKAESVSFTWSDVYSSGKCPKVGKYTYDKEKKKYTTTDFDSKYGEAELEFENLIFLLDETEYVVKANYKGSGNSETYCNYNLSGGDGVILSQGTALNIKWKVENKKLVLETEDGKEVKLNPGKSYIGYGSSNHGGKVTLNPEKSSDDTTSADEDDEEE
ncbi:MAG: DUF3048 domain-containing protein [Eubacterium sp.]|nr:DUF3048 domain-containing protein [Eubacterium sp.]